MKAGFLQRLARYCQKHYGQVFAITAVVVAISAWSASRLRFDADISNLMPRKDPTINAYLSTLADFGTFQYLLLAVPIPEGATTDPYEAFTAALGARLESVPELASVEYRLEAPEKLIEQFYPKAMLFADQADHERIAHQLSSEEIRVRVAELRGQLSGPLSMAVRDLALLDPLGLAQIFTGRLAGTRGSMSVDWLSGYYLSQDHRLLLLLAKPRRPPQDLEFDKVMYAHVQEAIAETAAQWPQIANMDDPPPAPEVGIGGSYVSAITDERLIKLDMKINSATSTALVLALFLFAFRRLSTLIYAFLPLTVGMILTFGFAGALFGMVSSATSGTAALLMGLGIDFVIVAYGRFVDERRKERSFAEALDIVMGACGRGVVVGAVTTAVAFYAFAFTDFQGLRQMGILTGTGILFCLVAVIVLLPAMLGWSEAHHSRRATQPNLYLHSFGVERLVKFCFRHPRSVLAAGALLTVIFGGLALRLRFNDNWREMRAAGNPGVEVERRVQEHFQTHFDYMMLVLNAPSFDQVLERTEEATVKARRLVESGVLESVSSVTAFIPPPLRQREALAWLEQGRRDGSLDPARIRADFEAALAAEGLRAAPFARGLDLLTQALSPTAPVGAAGLALGGQAGELIGRMLRPKDGGWQSVVKLYAPPELWRREAPPELHALARELGDGAILTGANVVNKVVRTGVRRDAWAGVLLGTGLVFLLVLADFRDVGRALFCMVPLALGVTWMLGAMVALGMSMNFMNVFVTTMILGVGVDYGLHMMHRYREIQTNGEDSATALAETGNAVLLAALTSIAGFGSLATSHYPGLRSTGYVATLGSLATVTVTLTLLPAFIAWREGRAAKASQ